MLGMGSNGMAGGGGGVPDLEQAGGDPDLMAMMAALGGAGPMGQCPDCGYPVAADGNCALCGYSAGAGGMGGGGAMRPSPEGAGGMGQAGGPMGQDALSAMMGGGGLEGMKGGDPGAMPPVGMTDTTGADADQASLEQLLAILQMVQGQGAGGPPGMMPPGMPPGGGPPPMAGGGPPPPGGGGGNPLLAALGRRGG